MSYLYDAPQHCDFISGDLSDQGDEYFDYDHESGQPVNQGNRDENVDNKENLVNSQTRTGGKRKRVSSVQTPGSNRRDEVFEDTEDDESLGSCSFIMSQTQRKLDFYDSTLDGVASKKMKTNGGNSRRTRSSVKLIPFTAQHGGMPRLRSRNPNVKREKVMTMAEAVNHFQTATPERWRSQPQKGKKLDTTHQVTIPQSPALQTRLRSRPAQVLTRQQQEELELQEAKSHQIKARPVQEKMFQKPDIPKKPAPKPTTKPQPFNITEVKKKVVEEPELPDTKFTARPLPKKILEGPVGISEKKAIPLTAPKTPSFMKSYKTRQATVNESTEESTTSKSAEGGPLTVTKPKPFTFEERDKRMLQSKEQKIQQFLQEEQKTREFHARPMPVFKSPSVPEKKTMLPTQLQPFSLAIGDRAISKEDKMKMKVEQELQELKKAASFKANPPTVIYREPFVPKKQKKPAVEIADFELNTEKRARERERFDQQLKEKENEIEQLKKMREMEEAKKKEEEIAALRKQAVHKAKPFRELEPPEIVPSDKPLTEPESPRFSTLTRSRSRLEHD